MPAAPRTTTRPRSKAPDAVCAAAVDLARAAAEEIADPGTVGEHLGVTADGDRLVTHRFASTARGYRGWVWSVTVARAARARVATVAEAALLPGDDALLPPPWVPWSDRLAPGDVGHGDVLPYREDDERLEPGFEATGDEDVDQVALWELGLGRRRVLSREGRDQAAQRWYASVDHGPRPAPVTGEGRGRRSERADRRLPGADEPCLTCGFYLQLPGALRQVFGVCANEWSPSDGLVVSYDHGCGAHSETDVERNVDPLPEPILDETGHVAVVVPR
ncbi:DUF3027 domain-containing protein [Kineosporiaceae bacterium SCSIO 59966]|nr:DUF3027 domain-containing protein [Kineosporiaceae bacterium SCSIO 59966]